MSTLFEAVGGFSFNVGKAAKITLRLLILLAVLSVSVSFAQTEITHAEAMASLKTNRDRLMNTYAQRYGYTNGAHAWSYLSPSQKGVFLTITDLLGRRTFMTPDYTVIHDYTYYGDEDDQGFGCHTLNEVGSSCNDGCYVHPINYYGPSCIYVSGQSCHEMGKCGDNPTVNPRTNHDMALNHVTKIYAINGANGSSCGGGEYNRLYFQADNDLIYAIRNALYPIPEPPFPLWRSSSDLAGPHYPFTQSKETRTSYPNGQMHEFAWDSEAVTLARPGVNGVYDPHIVELDIDYELGNIFSGFHPSNPECSYGGFYGRYKYEYTWYYRGLGGSAEYDYAPRGKF
ncbi:MAG TPA: hypothetical protein PKY59_09095 [Pyrinomonadaceae bacterium]|nr:hypothetical protein [Pyrinomonadaceae bacterium]